ncbi:MAG: hypothetical protein J0H57_04655, partial [Rhodospirillales bacterium]|nr:hypothetical protein [Rhodospirillales bacterium]
MARRPRLRRPTGSAAGPRPASGRFFAGWRGLGRFWLLILLLGGAGAGWLAWRGPPPPPAEASHAPAAHPVAEAPTHPPAASETPQRTVSRPP